MTEEKSDYAKKWEKKYDNYFKKTFKDIVCGSRWEEIKRAMLYYYPDQTKNIPRYKEIYLEMITMEPKKMENVEGDEGELAVDVGTDILMDEKETVQSYHVTLEPNYSIGMMPWDQILGLPVSRKTQEHFTREEIVAHVLWDFTFYGFYEKEIKKVADDLNSRTDEIKEYLDKEKKDGIKKDKSNEPGRSKPGI